MNKSNHLFHFFAASGSFFLGMIICFVLSWLLFKYRKSIGKTFYFFLQIAIMSSGVSIALFLHNHLTQESSFDTTSMVNEAAQQASSLSTIDSDIKKSVVDSWAQSMQQCLKSRSNAQLKLNWAKNIDQCSAVVVREYLAVPDERMRIILEANERLSEVIPSFANNL